MRKRISYLNILRFDQRLSHSVIAKYIANPRYVILLVTAVVGIGLYSFFNLPRTLNPEIKIPIVIISTLLPGAGPEDVETLITIPLEDEISGLENVRTVQSASSDSISIITIEFESRIDPEKARTDVQSAIDNAVLPEDAETPVVRKLDFTREPVWTFALAAKEDPASLMRYSDELKEKIDDLASVDEVSVSGFEQQEIEIILRPEVIASYGVNPLSLAQTIKTAIDTVPSGIVSTGTSTFALSINPSIASIDDIRDIRISIGSTVVALSDLAQVYQRPKPNQPLSYIASKENTAKNSVTFNVFKTASVNIDKAYGDIKQLVDNEKVIQDGRFKVYSVISTAESIEEQFSELTRDFAITITLVFIVLFIFLGIRQAVVASLTIPLTFLISFSVMNITGIPLSFISLFSLLLALGLLVDDTIVVISAMTAYSRTKKFTPVQTGLLVWRDFSTPVFTTTVTTVWAFLPLLLSTGIIGEFIKSIPIVASSTLLASFFVAMLITLPFAVFLLQGGLPYRVKIFTRIAGVLLFVGISLLLLPKGRLFIVELIVLGVALYVVYQIKDYLLMHVNFVRKKIMSRVNYRNLRSILGNGLVHFSVISERYHRLIEAILLSRKGRRYTLIMTFVFTIFAYVLLPLGFVKNEFFPKTDQDFVYISVELPSGTDISVSKQHALRMLSDLRNINETSFVTADIGRAFSGESGVSSSQGNNILFTLVLKKEHERYLTSPEIGEILRKKYSSFKEGKISIIESTGGPPAGSDLQIKLFGDDLTLLDKYANDTHKFLASQNGIVNIDKSIKSGTSKIVFITDNQKMSEFGLSQDIVGTWLRLFASGMSAASVKFEEDGNKEQDIAIRLNNFIQTPETISLLTIPSSSGNVSLSSIGTLRLENNPTVITREDGKRTLSVSASVLSGYSISDANKSLEQFANAINLPSGYFWTTGGVNEENQRSVNSILSAMILSFLLIIITMVIQFGSFRRALIVMLVIPLSISGVFVVFALTNTPLSFPALIGVLALFGIVVKNAILIVDKIVQNQKTRMSFEQAIADASSSRLEAIALTSVATIIGLLPITLSDPIWRGLGGAIIAGLSFSGTITLFFIPVAYYYFFPGNRAKKKK